MVSHDRNRRHIAGSACGSKDMSRVPANRPPSFMSRAELAWELSISQSTVDELVRRGVIPLQYHAERLLNDAADYIAATHVQPPDNRAWMQLLTYAPAEVLLERLIRKLNLDGIDPNSLTIGEIKRAL
jgi:hypothetical protein